MQKIAVLCAQGLGDGLLMMIVANHCYNRGAAVFVYHDKPRLLQPLFPQVTLTSYPSLQDFEQTFNAYDHVIMENDHSERAWTLYHLRQKGSFRKVSFLFPTPSKMQLTDTDYLFNSQHPIATNLAHASRFLSLTPDIDKTNGLTLPAYNKSTIHPRRVVIHPTSQDPKRNWKRQQFISLASHLQHLGYEPVFCVSPQELPLWESIPFSIRACDSLVDLALFFSSSAYFIGNDSGLGHLASNVGLPTLTISGNPKRVRLWRPDWSINHIVTLAFDLPNFKGIRLKIRENYWQNFISVSKVLNKFKHLVLTDQLTKETS